MRRRRPSPLVLALVALTFALLAWRNARADGVRVDGRGGVTGIYTNISGPSDFTLGGWAALVVERPGTRATLGAALRVARTSDWLPTFEDGNTHGTTAGVAVTARRRHLAIGIEAGVTWTTYGREAETTETVAHGFIGIPVEARFGGATAFVIEVEPTMRLDDARWHPFGLALRMGVSRRF